MMEVVLYFENGRSANGYANDPHDRGGETVSGLTRRYFPNLAIWKKLDAIAKVKDKKAYEPTEEEWKEIYDVYYKNFYVPMRLDYIDDDNLALQLFDFGVNAGIGTAVKTLQRVLGVKVDGKIGPVTVSTANIQQRVNPNYREARKRHYQSIVFKNPSQKRFLQGWLNRAESCRLQNE